MHEKFMKRCIELAQIAGQRGDSPVGALIVLDSRVLAEGIEANRTGKDMTRHAEVEAIKAASENYDLKNLPGCILYTTHEPCIMCSYVIRHYPITKVIAGLTTGEIGGYSSKYPVLRDTSVAKWFDPPEFLSGILEKECRQLHT